MSLDGPLTPLRVIAKKMQECGKTVHEIAQEAGVSKEVVRKLMCIKADKAPSSEDFFEDSSDEYESSIEEDVETAMEVDDSD